jgi:hypothetical protein
MVPRPVPLKVRRSNKTPGEQDQVGGPNAKDDPSEPCYDGLGRSPSESLMTTPVRVPKTTTLEPARAPGRLRRTNTTTGS